MMQVPVRIPVLRVVTVFLGLYFAVWVVLEGNLPQTVLLGGWTTAVFLVYGGQKRWGGQEVSAGWWVVGTAVCGTTWSVGTLLLTLFFMALKTGLHAHGPEFTPEQITWVIQQLPLWGVSGLLAGIGIGLLSLYLVAHPKGS